MSRVRSDFRAAWFRKSCR